MPSGGLPSPRACYRASTTVTTVGLTCAPRPAKLNGEPCSNTRVVACRAVAAGGKSAPAHDQQHHRHELQEISVVAHGWLHQNEDAVSGHQKVLDLVVALARLDLLADQPAQIGGERRIRLVDRLPLADEAAQFLL